MSGQILPQPAPFTILIPPGGQLLGLVGFVEALDAVNRFRLAAGRPPAYALQLGQAGEPRQGPGGLALAAPSWRTLDRAHTVVVGGHLDDADRPLDPDLLHALDTLAPDAERLVSICAGAFALGAIGALDGRDCTTHWLATDRLQARHPTARVKSDALYTQDGPVFCSAGASAGLDLALHLIRVDCGPRMAQAVARALVVYAHRGGGQSQFGAPTQLHPASDERIRGVIAHIAAHPEAALSVPDLARRAGMSPRHFSRLFREQTGSSPAAFVLRARVEAAATMLSHGDPGLERIAADAGFGSVESLRRAFRKEKGISPARWRQRFTMA